MKQEIKVKFLALSHDEIRQRLIELGALCEQPMRLMRRYTFDNKYMKSKQAFLRIRDEGHKTTMTYKQFDLLSVDGAREIEIEVSNFEDAVALTKTINDNWTRSSFQESKRENWRLGEVEIMLDEWPWLKPYIEIEGPSEQHIKNVASKLGLNWSDGVYEDVMVAYRAEYPHLAFKDTVGNLKELRFGASKPAMFESKL